MNRFTLYLISSFILFSCSKENPPTPGSATGYPVPDEGELMVYRVDTCNDGSTDIYLRGSYQGNYSWVYYYDQYCVDFSTGDHGFKLSMPTGEYDISASTSGGNNTWSGRVRVDKDQCKKAELRCGGMISGNAFEDVNLTGNWSIYVDQDSCGFIGPVRIDVFGNGISYSSSVYAASTGSQNCNEHNEYGAKFTLAPGDYSIYAYDQGTGLEWNYFPLEVQAGDCNTFQLWCN